MNVSSSAKRGWAATTCVINVKYTPYRRVIIDIIVKIIAENANTHATRDLSVCQRMRSSVGTLGHIAQRTQTDIYTVYWRLCGNRGMLMYPHSYWM